MTITKGMKFFAEHPELMKDVKERIRKMYQSGVQFRARLINDKTVIEVRDRTTQEWREATASDLSF